MTKWNDKLTLVVLVVAVGLAFTAGLRYHVYTTEQAVVKGVAVYYQSIQLKRCDYVYIQRPMGGCAVVQIRGQYPRLENLSITIDGRPDCDILLMDSMNNRVTMVAFGSS